MPQPKNMIGKDLAGKRVELRSIAHNRRFSQETFLYSAQLWVDGKHFCDVENQGQGGPDLHSPVGKYTRDDVRALNQWIESMLPREKMMGGMTLKQTLESVCHGLIADWLMGKDLDRLLKSMSMVEDGKLFSMKGKLPPAGPERTD